MSAAERIEYTPSQAEVELMRFAASGGSPLVRLAMRAWCRPHSAQTTVDVPDDPDTARSRVRDLLGSSGRSIEDPNGTGESAIWAMVRSGVGNLTWALIRVEVSPGRDGDSSIHVRATGLEGLVKQRIAARAVDQLADGLRTA